MENDINIFNIKIISEMDYKNPTHKNIIDDAVEYYGCRGDINSLNKITRNVKNFNLEDLTTVLIRHRCLDIALHMCGYDNILGILHDTNNTYGLYKLFVYVTSIGIEDWNFGESILSLLLSMNDISALIKIYGCMIEANILDNPYLKYYKDYMKNIEVKIFNNVTTKDATLFYRTFSIFFDDSDSDRFQKKFFEIADLKALTNCFWNFFGLDTFDLKHEFNRHIFGLNNNKYLTLVADKLARCNKFDDIFVAEFIEQFILGFVAGISSFRLFYEHYPKKRELEEALKKKTIRFGFERFPDYSKREYPANQVDLSNFEEAYFNKCEDVNFLISYADKKSECEYIKKEDVMDTYIKVSSIIFGKSDIDHIMKFLKLLYSRRNVFYTKLLDYLGYDRLVSEIIKRRDAKSICEFAKMFLNNVTIEKIKELTKILIEIGNSHYICEFAIICKRYDSLLFDFIIKKGTAKQIYDYAVSMYTDLNGDELNLLLEGILLKKEEEYIYKVAKDIPKINFTKFKEAIYSLNLGENNEWLIKFKNLEKKLSMIPQYQEIINSLNIGQILLNKDKKFITDFMNYLSNNIDKGNNYFILKRYLCFLEEDNISLEDATLFDDLYVYELKQQEQIKNISVPVTRKKVRSND